MPDTVKNGWQIAPIPMAKAPFASVYASTTKIIIILPIVARKIEVPASTSELEVKVPFSKAKVSLTSSVEESIKTDPSKEVARRSTRALSPVNSNPDPVIDNH